MIAFIEGVPIWLSISFLIVIPIPIFMIAALAKKGIKISGSLALAVKIQLGIILFYFLYLGYVAIASINGTFNEITFPPKILFYTMFPLLGFLLLIVFNLTVFKSILKNLSLADLVQLHIFRLIGSFFIFLFLFGALPKSIGLIAGIGDIVTALSSIFVVVAIKQKKAFAYMLTLVWNTFGLLDIIATSATALILTKISIENGAQGVEALAQFPFCFIPAFAPATIIFLHMSIYQKLKWGRREE